MREHFRPTRLLKSIRLYRLICSLSAVFALWGCGSSGSGNNNDTVANSVENQGVSNVNGESIFIVDNIPTSLADSMSVIAANLYKEAGIAGFYKGVSFF